MSGPRVKRRGRGIAINFFANAFPGSWIFPIDNAARAAKRGKALYVARRYNEIFRVPTAVLNVFRVFW